MKKIREGKKFINDNVELFMSRTEFEEFLKNKNKNDINKIEQELIEDIELLEKNNKILKKNIFVKKHKIFQVFYKPKQVIDPLTEFKLELSRNLFVYLQEFLGSQKDI